MKTKTQVYLNNAELTKLRKIARQRKRSVTDLAGEAIRRTWLRAAPSGPVGLWSKSTTKTSIDHDSIYDEP